MHCVFDNISTQDIIINDQTQSGTIYIINVKFDIKAGLIYYSNHLANGYVYIYNTSVISNQISIDNDDALFYFNLFDITNITIMNVLYSYNIDISCYQYTNSSSDMIGANGTYFECENLIELIHNNGEIEMNSITIDMNILSLNSYQSTESHYFIFDYTYYDNDLALIINDGIMNIKSMDIKRTINYVLIMNSRGLSVYDLTFNSLFITDYDPNALHSGVIIHQYGLDPSLTVQNSHFIGSYWHISLLKGSIDITKTVFEHTTVAILAWNVDQFTVSNCTFVNNGRYFNSFVSEAEVGDTTTIQIYYSQNIMLQNNILSGYDPMGLLYFAASENVILSRNQFNINTNKMYYNISVQDLVADTSSSLLISFWWMNGDIKIINNYFGDTGIFSDIAWLFYQFVYGFNCLSGNTFYSRPIFAYLTSITSCFRPQLINCIYYDECNNYIYEYDDIDQSLAKDIGYFYIKNDENIKLIVALSSNIVLDNVEIIVIQNSLFTNNTNPVAIISSSTNILFIDSYITKDISYHAHKLHCNVTKNYRLYNDMRYIALLLIQCGYYNYFTHTGTLIYKDTMTSSNTYFVEHLTPVQINLSAESSSYYTGQSITFSYAVMDRIHNIIQYNQSHNSSRSTIIRLQSESFLTDLTINPDGVCAICTSGVAINILSIEQNLGDVFVMVVTVIDDILYGTNSQLLLNIIGCPIGYGPDPNNQTCIVCNNGYYNLISDNEQSCKSCDLDNNIGINCVDGSIIVSEDYWMEFDGDSIVSSICPSNYCCNEIIGCDYISDNKSILCVENRDYESVLCGKCKHGYSEAVNTTKCAKCTIDFDAIYLLYPIGLSLLIVLFIIGTNTEEIYTKNNKKSNQNKSVIKQIISGDYFKIMMQIMVLKNIIYYQQALTQIISGRSMQVLLYSFAGVFNLQTVFNSISDTDDPMCFISGLNAKQKIFIDLLVPSAVVLLLMFVHIIACIACNGSLKCKNKKLHFAKVWISTFLIIIGSVLSVLFKLLNCQNVGNDTVHFYFGYENCYEKTWIISFVVLIIIVIIFGLVFIKLYRMNESERHNPNHHLNTIVNKYKQQYYFWEFILFLRRMIIALFAVSVSESISNLVFIAVMFVFLSLHYECQPFIINETNQLEYILISSIIFVIVIDITTDIPSVITNVIISFLIVFPFILMIVFVCLFIRTKISTTIRRRKSSSIISGDDTDVNIECDGTKQLSDNKDEEIVSIIDTIKYTNIEGNESHSYDDDDINGNPPSNNRQLFVKEVEMRQPSSTRYSLSLAE